MVSVDERALEEEATMVECMMSDVFSNFSLRVVSFSRLDGGKRSSLKPAFI